MNPQHVLTVEQTIQARSELINRGLYYVISPDKQERYLSRMVYPGKGNIGVDLIDCKGVLATGFDWEIARAGISKYFQVIQSVLSQLRGWLELSLSQSTQSALEMLQFYNSSADYITTGTQVRLDMILDQMGNFRCCDPNLIPLGFAWVAGYSDVLQSVGIPISTRCEKYIGQLVSLSTTPSGILTTTNYPNWPSHKFTSDLVRSISNSQFYLIPPAALEEGVVKVDKLTEFYRALDIEVPDLPHNSFVPGTLVRFVREPFYAKPETKVVQAPGIRLVESHLLTALPWISNFDSMANISSAVGDSIRRTLVPGVAVRYRDGFQLGVRLVSASANSLELEWIPLESKEGQELLVHLLSIIGVKSKTVRWFIKRACSSGFKGVRHVDTIPLARLPESLIRICAGFINLAEEIFLLQPVISSTAEILNEPRRLKVGLYLCGETLEICGVDMMTTPKGCIAVHGGSNTDYWIVA